MGAINSDQISGPSSTPLTISGIIAQGGTLGYSDTGVGIQTVGTATNYFQEIIQNLGSGTAASADLILSNNLGTATTYYVDIGMNSSAFTGSGSFNLANAGYLTSTSGDLVLGTTTNNGFHLALNSATTDHLAITAAGVVTGSVVGAANGLAGTATANTFTATQTAQNFSVLAGPVANIAYMGDSRVAMGFNDAASAQTASGYVNSLATNLQVSGFGQNAFNANYGLSGTGIATTILNYYGVNNVTTTGTYANNSSSITITGTTTGLTGTMTIGGPGIPIGTTCTISSSIVTLAGSVKTTQAGTNATLNFALGVYPYNNPIVSPSSYGGIGFSTPHQLSQAVSGVAGYTIILIGINDTIGYIYNNCTTVNGQNTFTLQTNYLASAALPYIGETFTSSAYTGTVTVTSVSQIQTSGTNYQTIVIGTNKNANTSSGSVSITTTPVVSAWFTQLQTLINNIVTDGDKVLICTIYKAYSGSLAAGDTVRQSMNSSIVSTYANNAVSGVTLCDIASLSMFGSNDPNVYRDGIHPTDVAQATLCSFINASLFAAFPSAVSNNPISFGRSSCISADMLAPIASLTVGNGTTNTPLTITGSGGAAKINLGGILFSYNGSLIQYGNGYVQMPLTINNSAAIAGQPVMAPNAVGSTVSGGTSGVAQFTQVGDKATFKQIIINCVSLLGAASYTFPVSFTNAPVVMSTSGLATSLVTSLSTSAATVTGTTSTGILIIVGY